MHSKMLQTTYKKYLAKSRIKYFKLKLTGKHLLLINIFKVKQIPINRVIKLLKNLIFLTIEPQ